MSSATTKNSRLMRAHSFVLFAVAAVAIAAANAAAQSNQPSEYDLLQPGSDSNLAWVPFDGVAAQAFKDKKPVLVYFYNALKTNKNASGMIAAQLRLFPDEEVKTASAHLLCTMVDLDTFEKAIKAEKEEASKAAADKADKEEGEDAEEVVAAPEFPVAASQWPKEAAIYLVDYRGRSLEKMTKVPSNGGKFASSLAAAVRNNQKLIIMDEKAAEKAAKEKARKEAKEAEKAAKEEKARQEEGEEEGGEEK